MIDIEVLRAELLGRALPEGSYAVQDYEAWLTADVLGSPELPAGTLHPMFLFIAGMCGVGYSVQDLFDLAHCAAQDGPMIGETDIVQHRSLRVGERVTVRTEVVGVDRKQGGSGTFDLVKVQHTVIDAGGLLVGAVADTHVFPRKA